MDKQIITFSANQQHLHKTGGLDIFATKTVSYIEAHFDLGDNWDGYDSIEAVWWNDRTRPIRTVLDTEGICIVPPEVLTKKGEVYVNLVGVISSGNTLTDRLTTHPITALTNKFNAQLGEGTTTPLTPSEYEQFVASVKADADRAEDAKDSARVYAGNALSSAQNALISETNASTSEDNAKASELNAETYKNQAQTYAQNAHNSAISAENAKDEAVDARDTILGMRAEATTLPEGSSATASYNDGVMSFGIPKGDTGARGATGETGATPQLSIGTVETTTEPSVTITGTAENPVLNFGLVKGDKGDTGEVSLADLSTLLPTDTASGSIASFPDGQSVVPALSVVAHIEPIQDLNGYDKPWSGGAGKNLLDPSKRKNLTANIYFYQQGGILLKANTAYTFSLSSASAQNWIGEIGGSRLAINYGKTSITYTPTEDKYVWFDAYFNGGYVPPSGQTTADVLCQLEVGSSATAWTPYSNICPISGRTEVVTWDDPKYGGTVAWNQLVQNGNFASTSNWQAINGSLSVLNNVATVTATGDAYIRQDGLDIPANHVCLFSGKLTVNDSERIINYQGYTQGWASCLNTASSSVVIAKPSATLARVFCAAVNHTANGDTLKYKNINAFDLTQMFGSTIADYIYSLEQAHAGDGVAYFRNLFPNDYYEYNAGETTCVSAVNGDPYHTHTTSLGRTVYGGTLDVVSGELVVDRAIVDLESLAWGYNSTQSVFYTLDDTAERAKLAETVCNIYAYSSVSVGSSRADFTINAGHPYFGTSRVSVKDTRYTDAVTFKAMLQSNNVQLCYELATPQTYQLTPTEIALLKGQNNVWTDSGEVEVTYKADVGLYIDKKLG